MFIKVAEGVSFLAEKSYDPRKEQDPGRAQFIFQNPTFRGLTLGGTVGRLAYALGNRAVSMYRNAPISKTHHILSAVPQLFGMSLGAYLANRAYGKAYRQEPEKKE